MPICKFCDRVYEPYRGRIWCFMCNGSVAVRFGESRRKIESFSRCLKKLLKTGLNPNIAFSVSLIHKTHPAVLMCVETFIRQGATSEQIKHLFEKDLRCFAKYIVETNLIARNFGIINEEIDRFQSVIKRNCLRCRLLAVAVNIETLEFMDKSKFLLTLEMDGNFHKAVIWTMFCANHIEESHEYKVLANFKKIANHSDYLSLVYCAGSQPDLEHLCRARRAFVMSLRDNIAQVVKFSDVKYDNGDIARLIEDFATTVE